MTVGRDPAFGPLVKRYLVPFSAVPLSSTNVGRVGRSVMTSYRGRGTADALPAAIGIDVERLDVETFVRLYDAIRPVHLSLSDNGEALPNPCVPDMVAHATRGGSRVSLVTDGRGLDPGRCFALIRAGLAKLNVPVDAADPTVYARVRKGGDLEVVLRNIEKLVAMRDANRKPGPTVEIQFVLSGGNLDQLVPMIELCGRRFHGITPNVRVVPTGALSSPPLGETAARAELRRALVVATRLGFRRTVSSLEVAISQLSHDRSSAPCYLPWYSAFISTDGEVYPCGHHAIRGASVGNALREPFADIWNGPKMRAFRASLRAKRCDDEVCASCRYEDAPLERVFGVAETVIGRR